MPATLPVVSALLTLPLLLASAAPHTACSPGEYFVKDTGPCSQCPSVATMSKWSPPFFDSFKSKHPECFVRPTKGPDAPISGTTLVSILVKVPPKPVKEPNIGGLNGTPAPGQEQTTTRLSPVRTQKSAAAPEKRQRSTAVSIPGAVIAPVVVAMAIAATVVLACCPQAAKATAKCVIERLSRQSLVLLGKGQPSAAAHSADLETLVLMQSDDSNGLRAMDEPEPETQPEIPPETPPENRQDLGDAAASSSSISRQRNMTSIPAIPEGPRIDDYLTN